MLHRRDLLRRSALLSLAPAVPGFLTRTAHAAGPDHDGRVLVVVQLDGGNDGLNTVVPYAYPEYPRLRPSLRVEPDRVIRLDDAVGLHPSLRAAADLLDDGRLAIVQGIGYPNPSRSHFRSMATWHTARLDPQEHDGNGWLGRAMDAGGPSGSGADAVYVGPGSTPRPLIARRSVATSFDDAADLALDLPVTGSSAVGAGPDLSAFVARRVADAYATAEEFAEAASGGDDPSARYPDTALARRLGLVARSIKAGSAARAYYVVQSGYDTHAVQASTHGRLLSEFARAVAAFLDDLIASGLADRVLVLSFSEFGRRPAENGSLGTDHGTAGPVFLAGPIVRPALIGEHPSLHDLDEEGDLRATTDFRQVYAAILEDWLGVPAGEVLGGVFESLPLFRS